MFEMPENYYRKTYFKVIDIFVQEVSQRKNQVPLQIESTLLKAANLDSETEIFNTTDTQYVRSAYNLVRIFLTIPVRAQRDPFLHWGG